MQCPRCRHENPPQAKFCLECGARVALTCAKCGVELPGGAKFCLECGAPVSAEATVPSRFASPEAYTPKHLAEKILTSRTALEGERKQVTVLFADLKGSMELLADRDPEEARKLLDPVLERMMEAVHRYEGTVNQVMGDGIMALFGAPLAHEDHAVRACYAALRMQESVTRLDWALRDGADLIITSAGVSVGAFDLVRAAIEQNGALEFWRVDLRPGKPLAFGRYRDVPILGLPGNPVSSFVTFELFAHAAMRALEGRSPRELPWVSVTLEEAVTSDGRESYLRAQVRREGREFQARVLEKQASSVLSSLAAANGLVIIPSGVREVAAGAHLEAWLLEE